MVEFKQGLIMERKFIIEANVPVDFKQEADNFARLLIDFSKKVRYPKK